MLQPDRYYFRSLDWISLLLTIILASLGLLFVFSATYTPEQPYSIFFKKQLIGLCVGMLIYALCSLSDHRLLFRWGYILYIIIVVFLVFTLLKGSVGKGGQRWINIGLIKIQPSELAKIFFPVFAAYHFHVYKDAIIVTILDRAPVIVMLVLSFLLIRKQPDLGTALIILFSGYILLWLSGISKHFFLISLCLCIFVAPLGWYMLKPYQKQRIMVFLGSGNQQKERYNIEQATIAIGSGGLCGKGFLKGTQNKLHFLPESRTDFIFAVLCEEWGFLGAVTVLILYVLLCTRIFLTITHIKAPDLQILAAGISLHFILSIIINIGMVLNLLPVVGIPLPLMSYGLSNLWVILATLGCLQSIRMHGLNTR